MIEATVITGASTAGDVITVRLPDEQRPVIATGWLPRGASTFPQAGDTALVVESDRGRVWVICWISE